MKKLAVTVALALSLLGGSQAKAVDMNTGNFVLKECNNSSSYCWGFLNGMVNASQVSRQTCIPGGVLWTQIRVVAVRYINKYPQRWHQNATTLFLEALNDAWPCQPTVSAAPAPPPKPTGTITTDKGT